MSTVTTTTGTTTATTTTTTTSESDGGKPIGIVLLIVSSLGMLLGIAAIIYSAIGINLALEGSGVEEMQKQCRATFATASEGQYRSFDSGSCGGGGVNPEGAESGESAPGGEQWTDQMCGNDQSLIGCSYDDYKTGFTAGTATGMNCMIAAGAFAIIGSIPILLNGIFSFLNKEDPARISGGCGVGLSVPSLIGMAICTIILLVVTALATLLSALCKGLTAYVAVATPTGVCTPECSKALIGTLSLADHLSNYFGALTWLSVALMILMLIESIVACVSCCTWKKKYEHHTQTTVVEMQQPHAPPAAPVVAVVATAVVEEPPKM